MFLAQIKGTEGCGGSPKRPAKMEGWHPGQKGMSAAELSEKRSRAQDEILAWVRAREYSSRASKYLDVARLESDPDVRRRFVSIAQHYRILAQAEERNVERSAVERRSRGSG
jgi:hypothetical protein